MAMGGRAEGQQPHVKWKSATRATNRQLRLVISTTTPCTMLIDRPIKFYWIERPPKQKQTQKVSSGIWPTWKCILNCIDLCFAVIRHKPPGPPFSIPMTKVTYCLANEFCSLLRNNKGCNHLKKNTWLVLTRRPNHPVYNLWWNDIRKYCVEKWAGKRITGAENIKWPSSWIPESHFLIYKQLKMVITKNMGHLKLSFNGNSIRHPQIYLFLPRQ